MSAPLDKPTGGQQALWDLLQRLREGDGHPCSARDLMTCGLSRPSIQWILRSWVEQGFVRVEGTGNRQRYQLSPDASGQAEAPLPVKRLRNALPHDRAAQNLWTAARQLRDGWSAEELSAHAITADVPDLPEQVVRNFVNLLLRSGYLRVLRKARPGRPARYRLLRDTGPRPPEEKRVRATWDPNLRDFAHVPQVAS